MDRCRLIEHGILKQWENNTDTHIVIPDGVKIIGGLKEEPFGEENKKLFNDEGDIFYYTFLGNKNIDTVVMSDSVEIVGEKAFEHCSNLKYIKFSKNLKEIKISAFFGCPADDLVFYEGLEIIRWNSLSSVKNITLPESVKEIDKDAFGRGVFIKAPKGSYAIEYAKKYGLRYREL